MAEPKKTATEADDALATSYLQHEQLNEMREYLERGRALQNISDFAALDTWVATFERWFETRTEKDVRNLDDAAAELRLRNLDLPEDRVRSKIDTLGTEIKRRGPYDRSDTLARKIDEFLAASKKPNN